MDDVTGTRQVISRCRLCPKTFIVDGRTSPQSEHTNAKGNHCFGSYDPGEVQCFFDEWPKPGVARPENMGVPA